jgi:hypothetical protein
LEAGTEPALWASRSGAGQSGIGNVSAGLVGATVLTLWDAWALQAIHVVSAVLLTVGSYYTARLREHAMVKNLGLDPVEHVSHVGAIPLLNL